VTDDELNASYIVPSVFHPDVSSTVAAAVRKAVRVSDQASDPAQDEDSLGGLDVVDDTSGRAGAEPL
jgi:malate dehydrogenase (oxaloacetate-decarboxylating)